MPSMTTDAVAHLIAGGESLSVELKIAPPRAPELAERICGMVNAAGGYIILGIEDQTLRVAGVIHIREAIDVLLRAARQCRPLVGFTPSEPEVYTVEGKAVVVATIPASDGALCQARGVFWIRRGTNTTPLTLPEIEQALHDRGTVQWERQIARYATPGDFDQTHITTFIEHRSERSHRAGRFADTTDTLLGLGCLAPTLSGTSAPTNAGILFFGRDPQRFVPQSEAVCVLYADTLGIGGYANKRVVTGTLQQIIDDCEDFLDRTILVAGQIVGWKREDRPDYPKEALREAVINAVIHRDYSRTGESIRIFCYADRIEIHSPGTLMPGLSLENIRRGEVTSRLRNPTLANLLRDVPGYMERIGSGIKLMLYQTREMGLPAPEFVQSDEFVVIFRRAVATHTAPALSDFPVAAVAAPEPDASSPVAALPDAGAAAEVAELLTPSQAITERQEARLRVAMTHVTRNGAITAREYRGLTGATEATATRDLELLVKRGALKHVGKTRGRVYMLP